MVIRCCRHVFVYSIIFIFMFFAFLPSHAAAQMSTPSGLTTPSADADMDLRDPKQEVNKKALEKLSKMSPEQVDALDDLGFADVCVSIKSSSVMETVESYRLFAEKRSNPLHVGVTEAGTLRYGTIKSACGIGAILALGIGDTIRVSLTADSVEEVYTGRAILKATGLVKQGAEIISCPTCGRTEIDIVALAEEVERRAAVLSDPVTIAVMGCVVNGPGEARESDYGIAGGKGFGLLFRRGEVVRKEEEKNLVDALFTLIAEDGKR